MIAYIKFWYLCIYYSYTFWSLSLITSQLKNWNISTLSVIWGCISSLRIFKLSRSNWYKKRTARRHIFSLYRKIKSWLSEFDRQQDHGKLYGDWPTYTFTAAKFDRKHVYQLFLSYDIIIPKVVYTYISICYYMNIMNICAWCKQWQKSKPFSVIFFFVIIIVSKHTK